MRQQTVPRSRADICRVRDDSYQMALKEAATFVHRGLDDATIEELTGISAEAAWEAAARWNTPPIDYLPLPQEIAQQTRAFRLSRPGAAGLAATFISLNEEPTDACLACA